MTSQAGERQSFLKLCRIRRFKFDSVQDQLVMAAWKSGSDICGEESLFRKPTSRQTHAVNLVGREVLLLSQEDMFGEMSMRRQMNVMW